jgi:hypothetical protein
MQVTPQNYWRHCKRIEGWLEPESMTLLQAIHDEQIMTGVEGNLVEIGVHHGRLFILLCLLARPNERAAAVDVFEAQHLNVDASGKGDRQILEANLRRFGVSARADIISKSSLDVQPSELGPPVRLFSIDGGHTTEIVLNDLALAEKVMARGGVVVLDDAFQPLYPGVATGLALHLLGESALVPFAVSNEKVLLTEKGYHDLYLAAIKRSMGALYFRDEAYFNHRVAIIRSAPSFNERLQLGIAHTNVYKRVRNSGIGAPLVSAARPIALKILRR